VRDVCICNHAAGCDMKKGWAGLHSSGVCI
jgi:hypothetical protein